MLVGEEVIRAIIILLLINFSLLRCHKFEVNGWMGRGKNWQAVDRAWPKLVSGEGVP